MHATDGVQVLFAGFLDKSSGFSETAGGDQQEMVAKHQDQENPKGLGLWPCYRKIHKWTCRTDGLTDGRTGGRTDGRMDGGRDGRTDG